MEDTTYKKLTRDEINNILHEDVEYHKYKRDNKSYGNIEEFKVDEKLTDKNTIGFLKKIKLNFMIKLVGSLFILFLFALYRYIPEQELLENKYINYIKAEYKRHYSREVVIEKIEDISMNAYNKIENIIPNKLYEQFIEKYIVHVKPNIIDFKVNNIFNMNSNIENAVAVFNENDIVIDNNDITQVSKTIATSSQISLMGIDAEEILLKNISIIQPVYGTITSEYGARDQIFNGVNGYHTGLDIANSLNTEIKSATSGIVKSVQKMDKYYGNNIEIETNGVIFKYAHLNEIKVNEGQKIDQGDIIGLMGSTGMSTGSHLHLEIIINNRTVDPRLILSIE